MNVVDITLMPAIEGTSLLRLLWLPCRMMPPATRNSKGSTKLKKAALGLRQNRRRSSRYWRHASDSGAGAPSPTIGGLLRLNRDIGGQLEVDVLERGPGDRQALEPASVGQRRGGQLVKKRGRIVGLALNQPPVAVSIGDSIRR